MRLRVADPRQPRQSARVDSGRRVFRSLLPLPVSVCAEPDPRGFYAKARSGQIKDYTGVSAPYEEPAAAELVLDTATQPVAQCAADVIALLTRRGIIRPSATLTSAARGA